MAKEMLINVSEGEECRIALLDDGKLEELYMERTSSTSHVGNIYKGRVTNVEPSIQAAFIDFGLGRNGFLHISDLMPTYFGRRGEDIQESVGRKMARRDRPPIQRCLRRGDEIIVQIIKEGIGTKGPTLSTYLSIPGKILVMMPGMGKMGVSKKIEDDQERRRLRQILDALKPPKDVAFIIRTAGIGKSKLEIERDLKYLTRLWETLKKKEKEPAPVELYTEGDLVTRTVRDVFSTDVDHIIVDNKEVAKRVKEVIKISSPRAKNKVELYEEPTPLFHKYNIEREIELMYSRHVPLPSGGSLVIDSTEAIVAIDVNSGKFRDHNDAETTAFKTDMEAADEIPRQLKLRDLGGVIICDFIDLRYERHRRELEQKLHDNFKKDRAKTKVLRMSQFGIIELTRQRMRPSLKRSIYFDCPHCKGAGLVKTPESMGLDVMKKLSIALNDARVMRAELSVCPDVAFYLLNQKRASLSALEERTKKKLTIRTDASLGLDELRFELLDSRDGNVILEEIGMTMPAHPHTSQLGTRPSGHTHQGRGGRQQGRQQRGRDNRSGQRPPPKRAQEQEREDVDEDRLAIERGEEAVEEREEELGYSRAAGTAPPREDDTTAPEILETHSADEVADVAEEEEEQQPQMQPAPEQQERGDEGPRRRRRRGRRGRGGGGGGGSGGGNREQEQNNGNRPAADSPAAPAPAPVATESPSDSFDEHEDVPSEPEPGNSIYEEPSHEKSRALHALQEGDEGKRRRRRRGGKRHRRQNEGPDGNVMPQQRANRPPNHSDNDRPPAGNRRETPQPMHRQPPRPQPQRIPPKPQHRPPAPAQQAGVVPPVAVVRTGSADKHLISDEPVAPQPMSRPRSYRDLDAIPDDYD